MIEIKYKIKGKSATPKKINRYRNRSIDHIKSAVKRAAENLDKIAMDTLEKSLGTGYTSVKWGHSNQQSIADSVFISEPMVGQGRIEVLLKYESPHAAVVELGGLSTSPIKAEEYGHKIWPIGKSQGQVGMFAKKFRVQPGYHYLERAKSSFKFQKDANTGFEHLLAKAVLKESNTK